MKTKIFAFVAVVVIVQIIMIVVMLNAECV